MCSAHAPVSSFHVLVVEDEESLCELFQEVLQTRFGCRVSLASSVKEAIHRLERDHCDLVLSDLTMAGGGGLDLVAWLRTHRPALAERVIIVTASAADKDLAQAVRRNEVQVLHKPFNATTLIEAVEQARTKST